VTHLIFDKIHAMTRDADQRLPDVLKEAASRRAYNVTIGGDGSVETMKDNQCINDSRLDVNRDTFLSEIVDQLIEITGGRVPKGMKSPSERDLEHSIYTFRMDHSLLDLPSLQDVEVGVYSRKVSPEATAKGGFVVFKLNYADV
jgi:hypothetical protein